MCQYVKCHKCEPEVLQFNLEEVLHTSHSVQQNTPYAHNLPAQPTGLGLQIQERYTFDREVPNSKEQDRIQLGFS